MHVISVLYGTAVWCVRGLLKLEGITVGYMEGKRVFKALRK